MSNQKELREAWVTWNKTCHPEDRIDWGEYLDEHGDESERDKY